MVGGTEIGEPIVKESAFHRRLSSLFAVSFCVEPLHERPFYADVRSHAHGQLRLASMAFSAHTTSRHPSAASYRQELFVVGHQQQGSIILYQDGREARIRPGDLYVLNATRDFRIDTEDIRTNSLIVPAEMFRAACPEVDSCTATAFPLQNGPSKPVGAMLNTLFEIAPTLTADLAEQYFQSVPYVLAVALANRSRRAPDLSRLTLYHKERIKSFIRRNLRDSNLDCDAVARATQLSPRYIYDLFADEPLTLMRWIWSERLDRCRQELENPALRGRTIGEIAFSWGFVDLAHFSRTFKKAHGMSPREFRNAAARRPLAMACPT